MKYLNSLLATILICIIPIGFTGCANPKGVKVAAYLGTSLALTEHPEWKPGFQLAYDELGVLENADTIGIAEVLTILNKLPVKELKSPQAIIVITATTILIQELGANDLTEVQTAKLKPVVRDIRAGIKLALDNSFADYNPDGTLKLAARSLATHKL